MTTQMLDIFGGNSGVAGVDTYGKNTANAAGQAALATGQAGMRMNDLYLNQYQPYDQKFMNVVDNLGTDAYRSQQRGQAMAGVQQQGNAQMQAQNRQMMAMGINPNSAKFQANNAGMAQQLALGKINAAMGADRSARDEYKSGLGAINAMGLKMGELGTKNMAAASDLGKVGLAGADLGASAFDRQTNASANMASASAAGANASANMTNANTNAAKLAQDATQFDKTYGINLGKLALDRETLTTGNAMKLMGIQDSRDQNSFSNVAANTALAAGLKWFTSKDGMEWLGNVFSGGSSSPVVADTPQLTA